MRIFFVTSALLALATPALAQTTETPPAQTTTPSAAIEQPAAPQTHVTPTAASTRDSFDRLRELMLDGCPRDGDHRKNNGPRMFDIHCGTREQALAFKTLAQREHISAGRWLGPFEDGDWVITADNR